jgi:hypothetical protein
MTTTSANPVQNESLQNEEETHHMSTSLPSGEGSLTGETTRSEVDPETAPSTGLEPDTAADAAGAHQTTPSDGNAPAPDVDEENRADPRDGADAPVENDGSAAADDSKDATTGSPTSARTELDGPALENPEMRRATEDLQSSEEKTAQAREFSDDLVKQTGVDER